jgi:hypothetical protein
MERRLMRLVLARLGRAPGGIVRNCIWIADAPTVSAEIAGA